MVWSRTIGTGWRELTARLGSRLQLVGDDLFTTNPQTVGARHRERAANAVLVKMNQIGTISETMQVLGHRQGGEVSAQWYPHVRAKPRTVSLPTWQSRQAQDRSRSARLPDRSDSRSITAYWKSRKKTGFLFTG